MGKAKIIPSILSNNPPWPGIMLPVSLIFDNLLKYETRISPNWLIDEIKKINIKKLIKYFLSTNSVSRIAKYKIILNVYPPRTPA